VIGIELLHCVCVGVMCLFPGSGPSLALAPNEKAAKYGNVFRYIIWFYGVTSPSVAHTHTITGIQCTLLCHCIMVQWHPRPHPPSTWILHCQG
jgi:hypothetical protein